jgi:hypothetical protein
MENGQVTVDSLLGRVRALEYELRSVSEQRNASMDALAKANARAALLSEIIKEQEQIISQAAKPAPGETENQPLTPAPKELN